jgi:hypothetical protein
MAAVIIGVSVLIIATLKEPPSFISVAPQHFIPLFYKNLTDMDRYPTEVKVNKKFWEEIIVYFFQYRPKFDLCTGGIENNASNSSSMPLCILFAERTFAELLPSNNRISGATIPPFRRHITVPSP